MNNQISAKKKHKDGLRSLHYKNRNLARYDSSNNDTKEN